MNKNFTPLTICLIDDDRIYQFTAKRIIELVDPLQKVLVFSNGKEAIDFFTQQPLQEELPDLIFLDINMPVMNGWEFLEAYHTVKNVLDKQISIYMVSSSVDEKDKIKSKNFDSVKDFIVKPIDKEMMFAILQSPEAFA